LLSIDPSSASNLDRNPTADYYVCRKDANQITGYIKVARHTTFFTSRNVTVFAKKTQRLRQCYLNDHQLASLALTGFKDKRLKSLASLRLVFY